MVFAVFYYIASNIFIAINRLLKVMIGVKYSGLWQHKIMLAFASFMSQRI